MRKLEEFAASSADSFAIKQLGFNVYAIIPEGVD